MSDGLLESLRRAKSNHWKKILNSADKDFDPWEDEEPTNPSWKIDLGDFWKTPKCECGSETVYGKDTQLHSEWCPKK